MDGGDTGGDRGDDTPDNSGIVAECTITPILQDDGQPVRELVETTKPKRSVLNMPIREMTWLPRSLQCWKRMMMKMKCH